MMKLRRNAAVPGEDCSVGEKGGVITAVCYEPPPKNKLAPNTILVGRGKPPDETPHKFRDAEAFAEQPSAAAFFKKLGTHKYEYVGDFIVQRWSDDPEDIAKAKKDGDDENVDIVLYCEPAGSSASQGKPEDIPEPSQPALSPTTDQMNTSGDEGDEPTPDDETKSSVGAPRQVDVEKRKRVEEAAEDCVRAHYASWEIRERQNENVGWDIEVTKGGQTLLLEVKGVSGSSLRVELTPNEYEKMQENAARYRVCVVVNALETTRKMSILRYEPERTCLIDESGVSVAVQPKLGAILFRK